jgi:hypothetical protein
MSVPNRYKLKNLLQEWPTGVVATAAYLSSIGISKQLCLRYQKSGWIEAMARGAFKKVGDDIDWPGAIYAMQAQLRLGVHVGALTAISLQGAAHYIRMDGESLYLFAKPQTILPKWFNELKWSMDITLSRSNFLPSEIGLNSYQVKDCEIHISSLERAILECLYLAPASIDLVECYQIMESLTTLRPAILQELLEACNSVKVTRLFLYIAEKANQPWFKYLNQAKFNIGKGKRSITKDGIYIAAHQITVPKALSQL